MFLFLYCWTALAVAAGSCWVIAHTPDGIEGIAKDIDATPREAYIAVAFCIVLWPVAAIVFLSHLLLPDPPDDN